MIADRTQIERWAHEWIAHWNARDVEAMLTHYRDDVRFESPMARELTGSALIEGKAALRRYWTQALDEIRVLRFELERVIWDPHLREAAIVYRADLDGQVLRCCELLTFDMAGQVIRGDACYGAAVDGIADRVRTLD